MKLKGEAYLSINDRDFCDLVADTLDRNVLYCVSNTVEVEDIIWNKDTMKWEILFCINDSEDK